MADLVSMLSSPLVIIGLVILGIYTGVFSKLFRTLSPKGRAGGGLIGLVIIGLLVYMFVGNGQSFQMSNENTENLGNVKVTLSAGVIHNVTTDDFYNSPQNDVVTFYIDDADIADDALINVTATIERTAVDKAATIKVSCDSPDMELSGIATKNIVGKTAGIVDFSIGSSSTHPTSTSTLHNSAYTEGDNTNDVVISFQQDETWEDGMTPRQTQAVINCEASGTPFKIVVIATD